jgi:hypothetical protein
MAPAHAKDATTTAKNVNVEQRLIICFLPIFARVMFHVQMGLNLPLDLLIKGQQHLHRPAGCLSMWRLQNRNQRKFHIEIDVPESFQMILRRPILSLCGWLLLSETATADTIARCGPNSHLGDYVINNGQRTWCSFEGSGPGAIVPYVSAAIWILYKWVDAAGGTAAIIGAIFAIWMGVRLTGTRPTLVQTLRRGLVVKEEFHPELEGTARTGFGHLVGNLLKFCGLLVFAMGLFSCANRT